MFFPKDPCIEHVIMCLELLKDSPRWRIGRWEQYLNPVLLPDASLCVFLVCWQEELLPCIPTLTMACCTVDAESTAKETGLNPLKSGTKTKDLPFERFCSGILLQQHKAD